MSSWIGSNNGYILKKYSLAAGERTHAKKVEAMAEDVEVENRMRS